MTAQTLNRFEWVKAVLQVEGLSATAKNIASALALQFFNDDTGQLNPSQETLADYLKVHKDTVKRCMRELRNAGWLMSLGNGGRSNAPMLRLLSPSKIVPFRPIKGGQKTPLKEQKRGDDLQRKGGQITPRHNKEEQYKEQKGARRSERPAPQCRKVVHHGSDAEKAWDDWLTAQRYPPLCEIGQPDSDAQGTGWDMPFRYPPPDHDAIEAGIAEKMVWWLINRANERVARYA